MSNYKNILRYDKPAESWLESMLLGNGRLGAVVSGDIQREVVYLDEESIWSGCPWDNNRPDAYKYIEPLRELIFSGQYNKARELAQENFTGLDTNYGTHLRAGQLVIDYENSEKYSSYSRILDIQNAIAKVSYQIESVNYTREYFCSHPDNLVCIKISADKPDAVNLSLSLESDREISDISAKGNSITLDAKCDREGVSFQITACAAIVGGSISDNGSKLVISNADSVTIFIDINSSYRGSNYKNAGRANIEKIVDKSYCQIKADHSSDFRSLFDRVDFQLGCDCSDNRTIDKRLKDVQKGKEDLDLIAKFFQVGRYLLISSSRQGTLAAHLQGVWNDNKAAMMGWTCDYHLDINTQMNYWHSEVCNLSECHKPLFELVKSLVEPGRKTAKTHYDCPGWVAHVFTNLWGFTAPGKDERWAFFPTGGLWLALHLAEHYRFGGDEQFLKNTAYPILKEAAEFFLEFLVQEPKSGYLVTVPATSEENVFEAHDGQRASVCAGPTCDNVLLRELFRFCIEASQTLGVDEDIRYKWHTVLKKMPPYKINKNGRLQEWLEDFKEPEPEHRHISHLLSVYPFMQITPDKPELAKAAGAVIDYKMSLKGWEAVGWNRAWNINIFARLGNAKSALENLIGILSITKSSLLTFHPPFIADAQEPIFELDGNTGATAGIAEMLLQSYGDKINLLPALPENWKEGSVRGLKARGGISVDIEWHNNTLKQAKLLSPDDLDIAVHYSNREIYVNLKAKEVALLHFYDF